MFTELRLIVSGDRAVAGTRVRPGAWEPPAPCCRSSTRCAVSSRATTTTSTSTTTRSRRWQLRSSSSTTRPRRSASNRRRRRRGAGRAACRTRLTRGQALRFGALLHDIAKPRTRAVTEGGRVTFFHHDRVGAQMASEILGTAASQRAADQPRRGAGATSPAARVSSCTSGRCAPRGLPIPGGLRAGRGRRHGPERRRQARDARAQRRAGGRAAPRSGARDARGRAGLASACGRDRRSPATTLARALGIEPGPQLGTAPGRVDRGLAMPARSQTDEQLLAHARDWLAGDCHGRRRRVGRGRER